MDLNESELGLIGACILEPINCFSLARKRGIDASDFTNTQTAMLWSSISHVAESAGVENIDALSIMREASLKHPNAIDDLRKVVDTAVEHAVAPHSEYYITDIIHNRKRKEAHSLFADTIRELNRSNGNTIEIIANAARHAQNIAKIDAPDNDTPENIKERILQHQRDRSSGFQSKWMSVENILGSYVAPENLVIAGRPSAGKTAFVLEDIVLDKAMQGIPIGLVELEMDKESLYMRMAASLAHINTFRFRTAQWTDEEYDALSDALEKIIRLPIYIADKRMSMPEIHNWAAYHAIKYGIRFLVVDFLQLIKRSDEPRNMSTTDIVGGWSADIKGLGKDYNMSTVVISQLNRGDSRTKTQTPGPPTLEALRASGDIEQNADIVMFIYKKPGMSEREFSMDSDWPIEIAIEKHRNGPTGTVPMWFIRRHQRFMTQLQYEDQGRQHAEGNGG